MSHTKRRYALLIENHLKHLKHEYGRCSLPRPPVEASFLSSLGLQKRRVRRPAAPWRRDGVSCTSWLHHPTSF